MAGPKTDNPPADPPPVQAPKTARVRKSPGQRARDAFDKAVAEHQAAGADIGTIRDKAQAAEDRLLRAAKRVLHTHGDPDMTATDNPKDQRSIGLAKAVIASADDPAGSSSDDGADSSA